MKNATDINNLWVERVVAIPVSGVAYVEIDAHKEWDKEQIINEAVARLPIVDTENAPKKWVMVLDANKKRAKIVPKEVAFKQIEEAKQ